MFDSSHWSQKDFVFVDTEKGAGYRATRQPLLIFISILFGQEINFHYLRFNKQHHMIHTKNAFWKFYEQMVKAVKAKAPFRLMEDSAIEDEDGVIDAFYDLPYAFHVTKHFYYIESRIVGVNEEGLAIGICTGEDYPTVQLFELDEIPVESLVNIYYEYCK